MVMSAEPILTSYGPTDGSDEYGFTAGLAASAVTDDSFVLAKVLVRLRVR